MKTPFQKRTINLLLASTIALTPFATNLAIAPNAVHAEVITDVAALAQSKIYDHLLPSDLADIQAVYENISKYSAEDFTTIVGADIIQKVDAKTNGKAVILAKDISKLLFQTDSTSLTKELNAFKSTHSDIFAGKLTTNDVMSLILAFENNLKNQLIGSLSGNYSSFDDVVTAAIRDTKNQFPQMDSLYQQELGISIAEFLTMKTNIEKVIDKDKIASAAFSSALIRSELDGKINGPSTYTIGTTSPSYGLTVYVDLLGGTIDLAAVTDKLVWKTNNSTIATMTGNKLLAKKAGKVKVVATYLGQPIMTKEITIKPDITAPATPVVNAVSNKDLVISGKAEVNSFITVKNGNATVATGYTSSKGVFSISLKNTLKAGTTLTVTAKDASGNVSKAQTVKVLDKIAPATPTVSPVDNNDTVIKGKAEAGSTITVKNESSTVTSGKTAANGTFSLTMKAQKAGSTLSVTAKDASGNVSSARLIKVIDKTAPAAPIVSTVDNNDTVIKGKAEAGAAITIKNGKTTIAAGKASSNGTFSIKIKAQKAGSTLTVTVKDAAGNVSKSTSTKVALATPTVNSVDNNDTTIKGKATPNAKITIKNGKTTIATGKTSSKGTFSIKIKKAQKAGSTLYITAKDSAGHVSKAKSIKVLDRIAPAIPRVYYVDSNDKVVRGKAEPNSYITVKKGSKVLGTGKTSSTGNYSVKIKAQKKGTVISITATDKSNNVSSKRVVSVIAK